MDQDFEITDFQLSERLRPRHKPGKVEHHKSSKPEKSKSSQLIVKISISAAICALALSFSLIRAPMTDKVTENIRNVLEYEMNLDETLGKLRFVDAGDVMSVFKANRGTFAMPVSGRPINDEVSGKVSFIASESEDVFACESGIVTAIGEDLSGGYVQIDHGNALDTAYYGLVDVCVEPDQPVKKGDAIAQTGYDGVIYIVVRQNGKPIVPEFSSK